MIVKRIVFFGQPATHACDGKCGKAWGINTRPRVQMSDDVDDYAYLADGELGDAPADPGTYEGDHAKPRIATGPEHINKWCVRECERAWISPPRNPDATPELPNLAARLYNIPPRHRGDLVTYDQWKTTEPDREPAPGEHQPGNDACACAECSEVCPECNGDRVITIEEVRRGELHHRDEPCPRCGDVDDRDPREPRSSSTDRTGLPESPR